MKLSLQPGQKTQTRERITNGLKPLVPRVLLIWAALLTFTAITTMQSVAQSVQPKPGWYYNAAGTISGESTAVYGDGTASLRIIWGNSYIYQHPGTDNLYWYAEAVYVNLGNSEVAVTCVGRSNPSLAKEWIRGDEGIPDNGAGYVAADETFCSRNPAFSTSLKPGDVHIEWTIFHNVPSVGEIALEWGGYVSPNSTSPPISPWLGPWFSAYPSNTPAPDECPPELVSLGTCQPTIYHQARQGLGLLDKIYCIGGTPLGICPQLWLVPPRAPDQVPPELQAVGDVIFCDTDVAGHIFPGVGIIERVNDVGKISGYINLGDKLIVFFENPGNSNNQGSVILAVLQLAPFSSCVDLLSIILIGPYRPVIIPDGVIPTPVPTPSPPDSSGCSPVYGCAR